MSRYWCKTCEIFIDDNKIARKQHDISERHKAGIKKAINDLHRLNREQQKAKIESEQIAGGYTNHKVNTKQKQNQLTKGENSEIVDIDTGTGIGQWEEVKPQTQPVLRVLGSPLKDPEEDPVLPKQDIQLPLSEMESREWDFEQKKIGDDFSDDENQPPAKPVTFKKRKVNHKPHST